METRHVLNTGNSSYTVVLPEDWLQTHDLAPGDTVSVTLLPEPTLVIKPTTPTQTYPNLETRTLSSVGRDQVQLAIPIEWARARDIEPGTEVTSLTRPDGALAIQRADVGCEQVSTVSIGNLPASRVRRLVEMAYRRGATRIEIITEGMEPQVARDVVRDVLDTLLCVEITEEYDEMLVATNLLDQQGPSPRISVSRIRDRLLSIIGRFECPGSVDVDAIEFDVQDSARYANLLERQHRTAARNFSVRCESDESLETLFNLSQVGQELHGLTRHAARLARRLADSNAGGLSALDKELLEEATTEIKRASERGVSASPSRETLTDGESIQQLSARLEAITRESAQSVRMETLLLAWGTVDRIQRVDSHTGATYQNVVPRYSGE